MRVIETRDHPRGLIRQLCFTAFNESRKKLHRERQTVYARLGIKVFSLSRAEHLHVYIRNDALLQ